jgi:prepilin-type N-terminal cleavage/methylation domain-containing protein
MESQMNREQMNHMNGFHGRGTKGLTVVEVLVVLAILAIMLSFTGSFVDRMTGQAELTAAEVNVLDSLRIARNLSRSAESDMILSLSRNLDETGYRISFASPDGEQNGPNRMDVPEVKLPDGIVVLSDNMTFTFDHRGLVEPTGSIVLAIAGNGEETRTVLVTN